MTCENCGYGTVEAGECEFCGAEPVKKVFLFKKRESEDYMSKLEPGQSEKDQVWAQMLAEFDKWQKQVLSQGYFGNKARGQEYTPKTREQLFAEWLGTPEGQKLYEQYKSASDTRTPAVTKREEEPRTLAEFGWEKLERIAKKFQENHPNLTKEQATERCMRENPEYQEIYSLVHEAGPLKDIDFSRTVSKSKEDAISLFKAEIISAGHKAGV